MYQEAETTKLINLPREMFGRHLQRQPVIEGNQVRFSVSRKPHFIRLFIPILFFFQVEMIVAS